MGRIAAKYGTEFAPLLWRGVVALANRQHGVVSLAQLIDVGLTARAVRSRVSSGHLHRIHRGVYVVGHSAISPRAHWMAAVLACGDDAALSHCAAAALHEIRPTARALVDVTIPSRTGRTRPGIAVHRTRAIEADEVALIDEIPCTSVARTLLDLAEVLPAREVERAVERAEVLQIFDMVALEDLLHRYPTCRGTRAVSAVLESLNPGTTITRSALEELFLELCRTYSIHAPELNAGVELFDGRWITVDALWRAARLVVELDGHAAHGSTAFERDRARDAALTLSGYRVVRFTWRQLDDAPADVAATAVALLAQPTAEDRSRFESSTG